MPIYIHPQNARKFQVAAQSILYDNRYSKGEVLLMA